MKTKAFFHVFYFEGNENNPLRKISFMTLEEGEIKNKDDNSILDVGEFAVATVIPSDLYALPLFNMKCSIHFNKNTFNAERKSLPCQKMSATLRFFASRCAT
jgi:hypothetical protein